jgi:hypothetical protein
MKVYLDMDGVICDFVKGLHNVLDLPYDKKDYPYKLGDYDIFSEIERISGIPKVKQYKVLQDIDFWENIDKTPETDRLMNILENQIMKDNVFILSTVPSSWSYAATGKYKWVSKNLKGYTPRIILSPLSKSFFAREDIMLIDDSDENYKKYTELGYKAYLVPRHWNSRYHEVDKDWVKELSDLLII